MQASKLFLKPAFLIAAALLLTSCKEVRQNLYFEGFWPMLFTVIFVVAIIVILTARIFSNKKFGEDD